MRKCVWECKQQKTQSVKLFERFKFKLNTIDGRSRRRNPKFWFFCNNLPSGLYLPVRFVIIIIIITIMTVTKPLMICFFLNKNKTNKKYRTTRWRTSKRSSHINSSNHLVVQEDEEEEVEAEGKSVDLEKNLTSYDDR